MRHKTEQNRDTLVFGIHPVLEAIESGRDIDRVLIQKGIQADTFRDLRAKLGPLDIPFQLVPAEKMDRITRKNHQGVIAFISPVPYQPLEEIVTSIFESGKMPLLLILDRITDVRNFGAIARTAECSGADAIVLPMANSVRLNADALKTSAGALNHLPVCRVNEIEKAIDYLQQFGVKVIACTEKAEENYDKIPMDGPVALLLGSEEDGISDYLLRKVDHLAALPMAGKISSLNVSVAAGIFLYEAVRQRNNAG